MGKIFLVLIFISGSIWTKCDKDFGKPNMFGSYDQLRYIQDQIDKNDCDFMQLTWKAKTYQGNFVNKMIALDVEQGAMMRVTAMPYGKPSWEFWYGFDKSSIMKDDPSDGFDLPNYTTSFDNSKLSKKLKKALKKCK